MKKLSDTLSKVVALLNDGQYHDGTSLGEKLNLTHAAVWKVIKKLEAYSIPITSIKGKGYNLEDSLILLDKTKIKKLLQNKSIQLELLEKTASTNEYLKPFSIQHKKPIVCIAETQTQGKGRLSRDWHSPFGQNIYLSLLTPFQKDLSELSGLSLVVGLAVCKALDIHCKLSDPFLIKWPNDIMVNQKKISGNLLEIQGESHGFCNVIIGIGINVNMLHANKDEINQQWTSLRQLSGEYYDRNQLCALLIDTLLIYLDQFSKFGLADFIKEWNSRDCLFNKSVRLESNKNQFTGIGAGINQQGHLLLTLPENVKKTFASGDTTLLK